MTDSEEQEDELLALASIYDEHVFSSTQNLESPGGHFCANLDLPTPFKVEFCINGEKKQYDVDYLPPVMLYFNFPAEYPSKQPPLYTLSCKWLTVSQLSILCQKLDELWEDNKGDVMLFQWTNFLKDETCDCLGICSPLDLSHVVVSKTTKLAKTNSNLHNSLNTLSSLDKGDSGIFDTSLDLNSGAASASSPMHNMEKNGAGAMNRINEVYDPRAVQDIASQKLLLPTVLEHDASYREFVFKTTLYTCQVCFLEKLGAVCIRFTGCSHVYCKECMAGYFEVQIKDGNVKCLTCPHDKCDSQAHPAQVSELVDKELFARYDRLLLQSSLDTMSDIVYCPRKGCNCAVMVDTESNMGSCAACHYVFCVFCKMAYHGVSPCKLKPDEMKKLRSEYESSTPEQQKFMEQRYGKEVIRRAIQETYTNEWLQEFSKQCPHCHTNIEKIDGCNKMTCTKCHCHFCWLCNTILPSSNPYSHFNALGAKCFNRLFHGVVVNVDDDDHYF